MYFHWNFVFIECSSSNVLFLSRPHTFLISTFFCEYINTHTPMHTQLHIQTAYLFISWYYILLFSIFFKREKLKRNKHKITHNIIQSACIRDKSIITNATVYFGMVRRKVCENSDSMRIRMFAYSQLWTWSGRICNVCIKYIFFITFEHTQISQSKQKNPSFLYGPFIVHEFFWCCCHCVVNIYIKWYCFSCFCQIYILIYLLYNINIYL